MRDSSSSRLDREGRLGQGVGLCVHEADPLIAALERDFEFLRERRWTDPPAAWSSTHRWPAFFTVARWGLAIVPLALVWVCGRVLEFDGAGLKIPALNSLGTAGSIWVLARGQPRIERGRHAALFLVGASTGLALAAAPFLLFAVQFSQILFLGLLILCTQPGDANLGVVLGLVGVAPIAILAITVLDAIHTLRLIRSAPLTWRETGWIYLGLFPGAFAGYLALCPYALFEGGAG
jgi:hypothetical protein